MPSSPGPAPRGQLGRAKAASWDPRGRSDARAKAHLQSHLPPTRTREGTSRGVTHSCRFCRDSSCAVSPALIPCGLPSVACPALIQSGFSSVHRRELPVVVAPRALPLAQAARERLRHELPRSTAQARALRLAHAGRRTRPERDSVTSGGVAEAPCARRQACKPTARCAPRARQRPRRSP